MADTVMRVQLPARTVGHQITIPVYLEDEDGDPLNLTNESVVVVAKALDPAGNKITPTATNRTQSGEDTGYSDVLITEAQSTTGGAGTWKLDVYAGPTGTPEDLAHGFYTWQAYDSEVE